jgi:hypothetical protein
MVLVDECGRRCVAGCRGFFAGVLWGVGAAVCRLVLQPSVRLVSGIHQERVGARHIRDLLRKTANAPFRRFEFRGGLVAGPRPTSRPHGK